MILYVDIALPGFTASNLELEVINVSGTSSRAYYSVDFFADGQRVRVPVEKYFTFGEPRNVGLLRYAASEGVRVHVRDDAASMHQQCYDDLRHRFALGLIPWIKALRDTAWPTQAPTPLPPVETSPELEAAPSTQAEEVKPAPETSAEPEATAPEINAPETEPVVDAPVTDAPSEAPPAVDGGSLSIDDVLRPGMMITEDERTMRIGLLAGQIEQYAQFRVSQRYDANARNDILRDIQDHINLGALGLTPTAQQEAAYARANEQNAWIVAQEEHARTLRRGLADLPLDMLRKFDLERGGWPE